MLAHLNMGGTSVSSAPAEDGDRYLIRRCLAGEVAAINEFQQAFGALVYEHPGRVYRLPADQAGDFYVFAFERGRIFRRLQTFEGRTSLRNYLVGCVLDNLFLEWRRGRREPDVITIAAIDDIAEDEPESTDAIDLLEGVPPSKALIFKLLYIEDYDLTPADLRRLAEVSGRSLRQVLDDVDRLRRTVRSREQRARAIEDALDTVYAWILLYERRLRLLMLEEELAPSDPRAAQRRAESEELIRKLTRRRRQRSAALAQLRRRKITAPYKQIASLLNTSVSNVASQIRRLKLELSDRPIEHAMGARRTKR